MKEGANVVEPAGLLFESTRCCRGGACPFIGGGMAGASAEYECVRLCTEEDAGVVVLDNED